MSNDPTWNATVTQILEATNLSHAEGDPSHTIRPASGTRVTSVPAPGTGLINFGETLGQGGMGVVRVATQASMSRPVAVKSLKLADPPPHIVHRLLQEAWVTGLLDHPNILPVHDIVQDEQGLPHIVMKRVEGKAWSTFARDADGVHKNFGSNDLLDWNLRIFINVCNAAHFAHDRGILHRDLKPDNVMVGQFGEVWVLDWGIAVALDGRWGERIPLAVDERQLAGTPRYLAPEMATCHSEALAPSTDVYLLGGVLHYLLAGAPPHLGKTLRELLHGIPNFSPRVPDSVPGALRRIVARALSFEPQDRYPDAASLRDDISAFLSHRGALALVREAMDGLLALEAGIDSDAHRSHIHALHGRAHFGFEQALREWPDNPEALAGRRRAGLLLVRYELNHGHTSAASMFLDSLDNPPINLRKEVRDAEHLSIQEDMELEERRRDADPGIGLRTRLVIAAVLASTWVIGPPLNSWIQPDITWTRLIGTSIALLAAVLAAGVWARETLSKTTLNRSAFALLLMVPLGQLILDVSTLLLGIEALHSFILRIVLWALVTSTLAATMDRRFWPAAQAYAAAAVLSATLPSLHVWFMAAGNLVLLTSIFMVWGRGVWETRG
ncbi:MAG: serine/threonine protein kinase [Kiritimatiellia bacterium]|jgi:serine/threonine protein kinase